MTTATFAERCTQPQRDYIRTLLERCELDTQRTTYQHRIPWKDARLPEPAYGQDIDIALRDLTRTQASRLIEVLQLRAGIEDEGDD